jgi:predicted small lipoprotein YifL
MSRARLFRTLCALAAGAAALTVLAGCGQKGGLYLPDKNASVVTSAPPASQPSPAPPPVPQVAPAQPGTQSEPPPAAPTASAPARKDKPEGDSAVPQ